MRDYLEVGPVPHEEECVQVGSAGYQKQAWRECQAYKNQLERLFPVPNGAPGYFAIKSFPHDFGSYYEVVVVYDEQNETSTEWAFNVENNAPARWDAEALSRIKFVSSL